MFFQHKMVLINEQKILSLQFNEIFIKQNNFNIFKNIYKNFTAFKLF